MDVLEQLAAAFAGTSTVVHGITVEQLGLSTPCEEWDVARLLAHVIGVLDAFSAREPNPAAVAPLADDVGAQFDIAAARTLATWRAPGALDGLFERPNRPSLPWAVFAQINLVDTFAHGCDLANATGQGSRINEDLAAICLDAARRVVLDEARAIVGFKPAVHVDGDTPPSHQLAAFLGRTAHTPPR
jgi:uncharacterized protein (TIGR03086 family)